MGKVNKLRNVVAVTKEMTVEYLKTRPIGETAARRGQGSQRPRPPAHQHGRNPQRRKRSPGPEPGHLHRHRPRKDVRKIRGTITRVGRTSIKEKAPSRATRKFRKSLPGVTMI